MAGALELVKWVEAQTAADDEDALNHVLAAADAAYEAKISLVSREQFAQFERMVLLQSIDSHWREHLVSLDYLRQGIHLRGYAQKNPKEENTSAKRSSCWSVTAGRGQDGRDPILLTVHPVA